MTSRRDGERGFALLIVFLLAAAVALMLYTQMPRVAFESEREKEQLLQDRGQQYVRAIQLYYIAFKKYPSKIEDLENTNDKRFLRRRYIDPMTRKDEWRIIHVNGAGQLSDSVVQKPPAGPNGNDPNNPLSAFGTGAGSNQTGTGTGGGTDQQPEVNAAVLRRPSDRTLIPPGGISGATPGVVDPNDPRFWPPITLQPQTGVNGQTGNPQGQLNGQQLGTFPGGFQPGGQGQFPFPQGNQQGTNNNPQQNNGQQFNNAQQVNQIIGLQGPNGGVLGGVIPGGGVYGFPPNGAQGNLQTGGQGTTQGGAAAGGIFPGGTFGGTSPGGTFGGTGTGGTGGSILGQINTGLTNPPQPTASTNGLGAGGIAGVASTYKGPSIKIYKERQKYNEWEFIFDLKQGQPQAPARNPQGAPTGPGGSPTGPGGLQSSPNPFGQTTNGQTTTGQTTTGQTNPGQTPISQ